MGQDAYEALLRFSDGVESRVTVARGTSVLDAALADNVPVLHQCRSGSCGTCVGRVVSGEADMRSDIASSLLASEKADGLRLTCVCEPQSDCTFEFDYDSKAGSASPQRGNVFVDAVEWLATDVVKLTLELAEGSWMDFQPGQFLQVKVPGTDQWRRYSMSSTPQDLPAIELLVRVLPQGVMSDYLRDRAQPDDVLDIEGPYGSFFWRPNLKAPHMFIAGGTGLAPMMSMLDVIRKTNGIKPPLMLSFGCQDEATLFYQDDIELREAWMPTLRKKISIDRGDEQTDVRIGNPVEAIGAEDCSKETVAYLCGPPPMINAAYEHLERLGVKRENIHAEQFVASE